MARKVPDYELPDQDGHPRRLSELAGRAADVLGAHPRALCPKDHRHTREIVELLPRIDVAYTSVVTITTDESAGCWDMKKATGATWPFLSDPARTVQQDLRIAELEDPHHNPMVPHTLVLAPELVVHSVYCGYWFWGRPSRDPPSGAISARCYRAPGRTSIPRSANEPTTCTIEDALGVAIVYRAALNSPDLIHGATFPGPRVARSRRTCPESVVIGRWRPNDVAHLSRMVVPQDQRFLSRLIALQDDAEVACKGSCRSERSASLPSRPPSSRCRRRWTFLERPPAPPPR